MAYPLTGSTQTATNGTVVSLPGTVRLAAVTRVPLPLSQASSLLVSTRTAVVLVSQPLQPPAVGQMWPRGGRS